MSDRSLVLDKPQFVPWDIEVARINFGSNCGPAAFAALMEREVCRILGHFEHFETKPWVNLTQMRKAFIKEGGGVTLKKRCLPQRGVALIQWLGPWTAKDFYSRWSLIHSHWIAVNGDWIFDYTVGDWLTLKDWSTQVAPTFVAEIPRATGWEPKYALEFSKVSSSCLGSLDLTRTVSSQLEFIFLG